MTRSPAAPRRPRTKSKAVSVNESAGSSYEPRITDATSLQAALDRLPVESGVYVMRDKLGTIVYVGKARSLKARVRQYFSGQDPRVFVQVLPGLIGDIETMVTQNEKEALLLENTLIKQHQPRFNVKLRDDKQYLVLRLDPHASWPRLEVVRHIRQDRAHYFGPYHSAQSARQTMRLINRHFQLRTCSDYTLEHRARPCLQYQIGRCPAPCVLEVDRPSYEQQVEGVALFLLGRHQELTDALSSRMHEAAESLEFERAGQLRDQLKAIETTLASQSMVGSGALDQDAIGMYREGGQVEFIVLQVRRGKVTGTQAYSERGMEHPDAEVLHGFAVAYYEQAANLPDEILLPIALSDDDASPLQEWLLERSAGRCRLLTATRDDHRRLCLLATKNAINTFNSRRNRANDSDAMLARTQARLRLNRLPRRIECFDISHIQGSDTVASMVVFVDGQAQRNLYRRFTIRGKAGTAQISRQNDDFASMYEVITRRARRALQDPDEAWTLPDLMVIDGGKGQLAQAIAAMTDLGIPIGPEGVDVVGLAKEREGNIGLHQGKRALAALRAFKDQTQGQSTANDAASESAATDLEPVTDAPTTLGKTYADFVVGQPPTTESTAGTIGDQLDQVEDVAEGAADEATGEASNDSATRWVKPERVFLPGARDPIRLRQGASETHLLTQIRDEAHRFAITHHRQRRQTRAVASALDDISGVGKQLKRDLLAKFGSVEAIRAASDEDLLAVKGVGRALLARLREKL